MPTNPPGDPVPPRVIGNLNRFQQILRSVWERQPSPPSSPITSPEPIEPPEPLEPAEKIATPTLITPISEPSLEAINVARSRTLVRPIWCVRADSFLPHSRRARGQQKRDFETLSKYPDYTFHVLAFCLLSGAGTTPDPDAALRLLEDHKDASVKKIAEGVLAYKRGNIKCARKLFREVLEEQDAVSMYGALNLALTYSEGGPFERAVLQAFNALNGKPGQPPQEDFKIAFNQYQEARKRQSSSPPSSPAPSSKRRRLS